MLVKSQNNLKNSRIYTIFNLQRDKKKFKCSNPKKAKKVESEEGSTVKNKQQNQSDKQKKTKLYIYMSIYNNNYNKCKCTNQLLL